MQRFATTIIKYHRNAPRFWFAAQKEDKKDWPAGKAPEEKGKVKVEERRERDSEYDEDEEPKF